MNQTAPKQILLNWIDAFNKADANALAALYCDNAVNHQVPNGQVRGKEAIRQMFLNEFKAAKMVCIPENILECQNWAVLEWLPI